MSEYDDLEKALALAEAERDLWAWRYRRLMGWVRWFRDDVCRWRKKRWDGLNKSVGKEDLFCASLEMEFEVEGNEVEANNFRAAKDDHYRGLAVQGAEAATPTGKPQGQKAEES